MRLIELAKEYEILLCNLEGDETDIQLEDELNKVEEALDVKLEACAWMIRNLEREEDAYKLEAKRLADKAKARANAAERLKTYVAFCLQNQIYKTKSFDFTYRKSESVEITDESLLTEKFIRTKVTQEPDKMAIKNSLKTGEHVAGAMLQVKMNLQIK